MRNIIVIYSNPETKKVEYDFPTPLNGVAELKEEVIEDRKIYIIPFKSMNEEQKAYYYFWDNGTKERVDGIIKNDTGAGVRKVLKWLIQLRIKEAFVKTGFQYKLIVISDSDKWNQFQKSKLVSNENS